MTCLCGASFGMQWLRRHIRNGSRLALLALAIQFVATFGHFHPLTDRTSAFETVAFETDVASIAVPDDRTADQDASAVPVAAGDARSAHHHHTPASPDLCSICAVMALVDTALPATPPVLLPPQAAILLVFATDVAFEHMERAGTAFQSRAPPAS